MESERNPDEADIRESQDRGPKSRKTASERRSCASCGRPLTGRKERFCSDRCRMRNRRERERGKVYELLQRLEDGLNALREELVGEVEP